MDPTTTQLKEAVDGTKAELKAILHEENAFALFQLRRRYYESGDKAGKMLALRLKQQENQQTISSVYDINETLVSDQRKINEAFTDFYSISNQMLCE